MSFAYGNEPVLKNPPILILDEVTSARDAESERWVQDALYKPMENPTSFVIAHRLSTIQHADEIIVLPKGKIVERGPHQQLLDKQEIYKKLHAYNPSSRYFLVIGTTS